MSVTINGSTGIEYTDNIKNKYGTGADLEIYHDGTDSRIANSTGYLIISDTNGDIALQGKAGEESLICRADGGVELYYNNAKRAETYADGLKVPAGGELYIDGNAASGHCQLIMTRSDRSWLMTNQTYMRFYTKSGNSDSPDSNVFEIQSNGNIVAAGELTENSDVSLKENIVTIPDALSKVKQLRGVEFDKKATGEHDIGCVAQEVQSVIPDLVKPRSYDDPLLTVSYTRLTPVLIEAVKELTAKVETLETEVNTLKTKVAALEAA